MPHVFDVAIAALVSRAPPKGWLIIGKQAKLKTASLFPSPVYSLISPFIATILTVKEKRNWRENEDDFFLVYYSIFLEIFSAPFFAAREMRINHVWLGRNKSRGEESEMWMSERLFFLLSFSKYANIRKSAKKARLQMVCT